MSRKIITLEIDIQHEDLLRQDANFVEEMKDLAATAPDGSVLDTCEEAAIEKGREHQRRLLQRAVQSRLDTAEKRVHAEGQANRVARNPARIGGIGFVFPGRGPRLSVDTPPGTNPPSGEKLPASR